MPERLPATPCCMSSLQQNSFLLFRQTVDSLYLSSFDKMLLLILFSNLSRLVLHNILCWNSHSSRRKINPSCWLSLGGATMCCKFDEFRVNKCVQSKKSLKCTKNYADCFRQATVYTTLCICTVALAFSATLYTDHIIFQLFNANWHNSQILSMKCIQHFLPQTF